MWPQNFLFVPWFNFVHTYTGMAAAPPSMHPEAGKPAQVTNTSTIINPDNVGHAIWPCVLSKMYNSFVIVKFSAGALNICVFCSFFVGVSLWRGVGGGSVWLYWEDRGRAVLSTGRLYPHHQAHGCWVELWQAQRQGGPLPQELCRKHHRCDDVINIWAEEFRFETHVFLYCAFLVEKIRCEKMDKDLAFYVMLLCSMTQWEAMFAPKASLFITCIH